jgi:hypothetical protein
LTCATDGFDGDESESVLARDILLRAGIVMRLLSSTAEYQAIKQLFMCFPAANPAGVRCSVPQVVLRLMERL